MPNIRYPRRGSMQFWPRVRASKSYPTIGSWPKVKDIKLLGFAGYKAGMTHIGLMDRNPNSHTKNTVIFCPVTVVECPPIKILAVRLYKHDDNNRLHPLSDIFSKNLDKELKRKVELPKTPKSKESKIEDIKDVKIVAYTQPKLTGVGKKKPEIIELAIGGDDIKTKIDYAKSLLDKELKVSDIFQEGQEIDVHAVTKGKGYQGPVKRFGVKIRSHKAEKTKRGPGSLGPWKGQGHIMYRVAHAGKMGFHTRTEYNKWLLKTSNNPKEINPKGGFLHYGIVKNDYVLVKGSVPGPSKRLIELTEPLRSKIKQALKPEISYISIQSKQ